jgi:hypothetical protein
MPENKIIITMEGGLVQDVTGIPRGVRVRIVDFDIEGADPEELTLLENGRRAAVSEYTATEPVTPESIAANIGAMSRKDLEELVFGFVSVMRLEFDGDRQVFAPDKATGADEMSSLNDLIHEYRLIP